MSSFQKKKAAHLRLGKLGEDAAQRLYVNDGCEILTRDLRLKQGELDLVVRDGKTLVFAEVKTLRYRMNRGEVVRPIGNLRDHQKYRICHAAMTYLKKTGLKEAPFRFDIVEVIVRGRFLYQVYHWKRAFGRASLKKQSVPNFFV